MAYYRTSCRPPSVFNYYCLHLWFCVVPPTSAAKYAATAAAMAADAIYAAISATAAAATTGCYIMLLKDFLNVWFCI